MSIKVSSMVWDKWPSGGSEMLCMLALADWCNDEGGSLYPSIKTLARKMRVSERQAQRVLGALITKKYVSVIGNENGGAPGTTRQYHLNVKALKAMPELSSTGDVDVTPNKETGDTGDVDGCHGCRETGDMGVTQSVSYPLEDPLEVHVSSDDEVSKKSSAYPDSFEECWKAYPKRNRPEPKKAAFKAWNARVKAKEATPEQLLQAAKNYARSCSNDGSAGTQYVKMAATFFGPNEHWAEYAKSASVHQISDRRSQSKAMAPTASESGEEKCWFSNDNVKAVRPLPFGSEQFDDDSGRIKLPDGRIITAQQWKSGEVRWEEAV